jgi:hypothetical protein
MSPLTIVFQIRDIIASMLSNLGISWALSVSLANFSLAAILIVLLLIFPQIVVLILFALFILFGLRH